MYIYLRSIRDTNWMKCINVISDMYIPLAAYIVMWMCDLGIEVDMRGKGGRRHRVYVW